jgi:eukaryotic-like serine/threonine-protein kinase
MSGSGPVYRRLFKIGDGGMATVYLGRIERGAEFSRLVAIKRPHPHLVQDDPSKRQLLREARTASAVRHANVVSVWDVDTSTEQPLLVMDYVEGPTLSELAKTGPIPHAVALRILLEACHGLHAIHTAVASDGSPLGLVHRDVSPQNVLVGVDGVARIADFGIARSVHDVTRSDQNLLKGKLAYMAPEYVQHGRWDAACDIHAMAVMGWELLAQRRAFEVSHEAGLLRQILTHDFPLISEVAPALGSGFDDIVARGLSKDPSLRPDAAELAREIEAAAIEAGCVASRQEVGDLVVLRWGSQLAERRRLTAETDAGGPAQASTRPVRSPARRVWLASAGALVAAAALGTSWWLARSRMPDLGALPVPSAPPAPMTPPAQAAPATPAETASAAISAQPARPVSSPKPRRSAPPPRPAPSAPKGLPPNPYASGVEPR